MGVIAYEDATKGAEMSARNSYFLLLAEAALAEEEGPEMV